MKMQLGRRIAAVSFAAMVLAGTAHADTGTAVVGYLATDEFKIGSDGYNYVSGVQNLSLGGEVNATVHIDIDTDVGGAVKSWSTYLLTARENLLWIHHSETPYSMSYPIGSRPKDVAGNVPVSASFTDTGVAHCNQLADDLRGQGLSNEQIFGEDRILPFAVRAGLSFDASGAGGSGDAPDEVHIWDHFEHFDLVCQKFEAKLNPDIGPAAGHLRGTSAAHLTSMSLDMIYAKTPTSCPTEVTAKATFVSDTAGDFTTRFRSVFGQVSQPIKLSMGPSDRQGGEYVKTYEQKFMVGEKPMSDPTRTKPARGFSGTAATGFADLPGVHPDDEIPSGPARPAQAGKGKLAGPTDPGLLKDSLWVELVTASPDSVARSDYAEYKVTCPKLNPTFNPVGGVANPTRPAETRAPTAPKGPNEMTTTPEQPRRRRWLDRRKK
ncbi:MAG: hypothetical protein GY723_11285 [bacterium]|nr:hypothetical protein [bacterium]MCP5067317.1 hypothetical protein [bacterium]